MQIDFNLYGMGLLRLGHVLFRHPVPTAQHTRLGWAESPVLVVSEGGPPDIAITPDHHQGSYALPGVLTCVGMSSPTSHSKVPLSNQPADLTPASAAAHSQASRLWTANDIPSQWLWSNVPAGARYHLCFPPSWFCLPALTCYSDVGQLCIASDVVCYFKQARKDMRPNMTECIQLQAA